MLWRIVAAVGGAGGLGSLLLPYAHVTGGALGVDLQEGTYTLFELAQVMEDAGNDPTVVYALAVVIGIGSTFALAGALVHHYLAGAGGVIQGGAAAAFWYGVEMEGSEAFLAGLAQFDATFEYGFFVLVAACGVTLFSLVLWMVTAGLRSGASSSRSGV